MAGMSYLDIARSVRGSQEKKAQDLEKPASHFDCTPTECEKSERSEKRGADAVLTAAEAEDLKQAILAAVLVEPKVFDRERYDLLMGRWLVHESALAALTEGEACA